MRARASGQSGKRSWGARLGRLGGVLLLSLLVLVALVLAGLNLPWVRARLAEEVSRRLSAVLAGTVHITDIGYVGLGSVSGIDAELLDHPSRRRVLAVSDASVDLDLGVLLQSLLGEGPLTLAFENIALAGVEAHFLEGPGGGVSLIEAFAPAPSADDSAAEREDPRGAPPPRLRFDRVSIGHASLRGALGDLENLDVVLRELVANGSVDAETARFELVRVDVSARQLPAVNDVEAELSLAGTVGLAQAEGAPLALDAGARLRGTAAGLPVHARARYIDGHVSGYLEVEATPGSLQRLWPDLAVEDPVRVFIGFEGTTERLSVLAVLESGAGALYVNGHVALAPRVSGRLSVLGQQLEARGWLSEMPESSVQLAAALRFEVHNGVRGQLALRTWSANWAGRALPDLALSAQLSDDDARATLRFELGGGRAQARVRVSPLGGRDEDAPRLDVHIEALVPDLARLGAELGLAERLGGDARLDARASLELQGVPSIVEGRLSATLGSVNAGAVSISDARLEVVPEGPLGNPRLGLSLDARGLALPGYALRRVRLQARGVMEQLALQGRIEPEATAPVRLEARVFPTRQLARDVEIVMDEDGPARPLRLSAEQLGRSGSGWEVRHLEIEGPITGRLQLDGVVQHDRVRAEGSAIDFAPVALARSLGLDVALPTGVADLTFAVDYRPEHISGQVRGRLARVCIGELRGGTLETELVVDDNVVDGFATVHVPELGHGHLRATSLVLPARLEGSRLGRVNGELELLAETDLARLQTLPFADMLPPSSRGRIRARALLTGAPGEGAPKLHVDVSAQDLAWLAPSDTPTSSAARARAFADPASATWQGMDVELVAEVDATRVHASASVVDSRGAPLASLRAATQLPLARLLRAPDTVDPRQLPIELHVDVPARELDAFPLPLRYASLDGSLRAHVTATGTLGRPKVTGRVELTQLRIERGRALPLALIADARLEADQLELTAAVRDERRQLLSLLANARVSGGGAPPRIEQLGVELRSNGLPLESLGAVLGARVAGELYGSLHVRDLLREPRAQGTLWINEPRFRGFRQDQARWVIDAGASSFFTELALRQPGGNVQATASGPWQWSGQLLPTLEPDRTRLEIEAEDFDLQGLGVFLPEEARGLSGRLDADLAIDPGAERSARGRLQLREGGIYVAALGQEFHDIALDANIEPSGVVRIGRLSARTLSGRLSARGEATLDGLVPRSAHLAARIPRDDPMPIMLSGVTVAEASGRFELNARLESSPGSGNRLELLVSVPRLHVGLPEQSPHDVQELDDDPTITTGTYLQPNRFLTLPIPVDEEGDASPTEGAPLLVSIEVRLGDEVWIERGTQLEVKLLGSIDLELNEELSARGELRLGRGTINVQGRTFEVERGVVTFVRERAPSNPTVVATARYTAPDGTEIYADFVGPVETGTLTLRSQPPLRDDQILSVLLFGTQEGNFGASTSKDTAASDAVGGAAIAAGGSLVTRGLNQELRRLTALDIQTRIGESEGQPQPEVVVQLSPRLTAELAYSMGTPNPGRQQDRTYLTLDLRLFRNWSISTTVGDAGSLLVDLLWRYRY